LRRSGLQCSFSANVSQGCLSKGGEGMCNIQKFKNKNTKLKGENNEVLVADNIASFETIERAANLQI
jgi:hypothetical protein